MQAQGIVDTVPDPMLVLDSGLTIQSANRAFFRTFAVERYDTIGQHLYDLGNGQWDIPELRRLLREVIPKSSAVIDYKVEHDFPHIGKKIMLLTARTVFNPDTSATSCCCRSSTLRTEAEKKRNSKRSLENCGTG
ncbi:PAS domain-containing protein [Mesorhizobium atlanticum]